MFTLFSSPWEGPFKTCIASVTAFAVSGALYVPPPSSFAINDPLERLLIRDELISESEGRNRMPRRKP